jgi:AcrR family transcriptional regulator
MVQFFMQMPIKTLRDAPTFKDQRRERIIQVARSVFYEVGYAGASMSMISSRLGGSKATLYAYFNSKEDLFEAIIREQCEQLADLFLAHTGTNDLRTTLTIMGRDLLTTIMSDEAIRTFQLIVEESHRNPQLAEMFHNVIQSQGRANLTALLQTAHDKGQINAPNILEATIVLKSLIFGDCHFKRIMNLSAPPTEEYLSRQVALAVDIFMTYYSVKPTA